VNLEDVFKGSDEQQSINKSIEKIDHQIQTFRKVALDPRSRIKTKKVIGDLKWEREKLIEKLKG
jgi:hypothetical protein